MLYPWLDVQRSWLLALLDLSRLGGGLVAPLDRLLHPARELAARTLAAGSTGARALADVVRADAPFPVKAEVAAETPFARLVRLRRSGGGGPHRRRSLLLAPCSGYAAAVLGPLATVLAAQGEVVATEWTDARLVPPAEGPFGLRQQVELALAAAMALDGPAHLVALSQSGPAALTLAALLAERAPERRPASLAFLGCQLDPTAGASPLRRFLGAWPRDLLLGQLTATVGPGYPGVGRRVYPAVLQLLTCGCASPQLHAEVQGGLLRELAAGGEAGGVHARQHADLHSLADVPAELFADTLGWMLAADDAWGPDGAATIAGARVDLSLLRALPVLTLESGRDELVGQGQTHALAARLGVRRARAVTLPLGRHHDLFTGPGFLTDVAPLLRRFHDEHDAAATA